MRPRLSIIDALWRVSGLVMVVTRVLESYTLLKTGGGAPSDDGLRVSLSVSVKWSGSIASSGRSFTRVVVSSSVRPPVVVVTLAGNGACIEKRGSGPSTNLVVVLSASVVLRLPSA